LRIQGGFRCLDIGNSTPQQRAQHRSTVYKENLTRLRDRRMKIQEELHSIVECHDDHLLALQLHRRSFSPSSSSFALFDVDELNLTSLQLEMLMSGCDEALQAEQLAALATTNVLRPLSDLVRDLLLEDTSGQSEAHSTITAASLYERFENVRLKVRSATTFFLCVCFQHVCVVYRCR
jgi:hypothetical protein